MVLVLSGQMMYSMHVLSNQHSWVLVADMPLVHFLGLVSLVLIRNIWYGEVVTLHLCFKSNILDTFVLTSE